MKTLKECFDEQVSSGGFTDKGTIHSYLDFYDQLLQTYRDREFVNILEVGVRDGSSLRAWRSWFSHHATIYGFDNWSEGMQYAEQNDDRFYVGKADSCKPDTVIQLLQGLGIYGQRFDVIIDDGDHHPFAQAATFGILWPYLKCGGLYIVEDVRGIEYARDFKYLFGGEIEDRREIKGRHDDILWVKKKE